MNRLKTLFPTARTGLLCIVAATLLTTACSTPFTTGGSQSAPVDVPEPGSRSNRTAYPARTTPPPAGAASAPSATVRVIPAAPGVPVTSTPGVASPAAPANAMPLPGGAPAAAENLRIEPLAPNQAPAASLPDFVPAQSHNSAVNTLLAQSDAQRRNGDLDAAIASAERALRISPDDPTVYYQLAALRLRRGDAALAEQLARKGLSYQPDAELRDRLNDVIRQIRSRA
jgi:Tetratricopeptide repeat